MSAKRIHLVDRIIFSSSSHFFLITSEQGTGNPNTMQVWEILKKSFAQSVSILGMQNPPNQPIQCEALNLNTCLGI